jgi:hypothetical protein
MSGILSANMTVRRKEEALRIQARLQRIDAQLDHLLADRFGGAQAPPTPAADPRVTTLARAMGHVDYHLPTGSIASLTFDDDNEIIATGLTLEGRFWSILDIVKLGLINERGAWLWSRYSAIAHVLPPVSNDHLRPCYPATVAGRAYERGGAIG